MHWPSIGNARVVKQELSHPTVLLVVAAMLFASLPHLFAMPPAISVAIVGAAGWRLSVEFRDAGRPGWLLRLLLTVGGLGLIIVHLAALGGRRAATAMLCVMLALKLTEMFRIRDARVVAMLGYFLITTQFLFNQRLEMLAYLLAGCWLVTMALIQLQRDDDGLARPRQIFPLRTQLAPLMRAGAMLTAFALPFALVTFMLFPRLSSPLWGMPDTTSGRSGLSDEMSPGQIADLFLDDSPAFRARFESGPPSRQQLYWRGPVLWDFDGRTWKASMYSQREPHRLPEHDEDTLNYTVQMEPSDRKLLLALDYPIDWPEDAKLNADFELRRDSPVTSLTEYTVRSQPDFIDMPRLPPVLRQAALALPEGANPRTREYAAELRQRYPESLDLIEAVLQWFNREEFFYSLQTAPLGRHGADEFLFDLRSGYCEYYASAFAILMRAAGIPTRVVTGYHGGLWQASEQYLLVRQSDAHAWTEVWLPNRGWVRVDPTAAVAPSRIESGARGALPGTRGWTDADWLWNLRNHYDRLQHFWNRQVLAFDFSRQQRLLASLGLGGISTGMQALLLTLLAMLVLAPLGYALHIVLRHRHPQDPLNRAWARVRRRLARIGIASQPGESPLELATRARPMLGDGHELLTLCVQYCNVKYGHISDSKTREAFIRGARRFKPSQVNHIAPDRV